MSDAPHKFSYEQALSTLPTVKQLTHAAVSQIEALVNQVKSRQEMDRRKGEIEEAIEAIVGQWRAAVTEMGCEAKGLWLVDWDNGDGYYCWRYPEETIAFFHSYEEGFAGRIPVN